MTDLKIKKLNSNVDLPQYESQYAAGMDIKADLEEAMTVEPGERVLIPTGIAIELPIGYEAQIRPRSGLAIKKGISLVNSPGTIDADYRGEIKIIVINHGQDIVVFEPGDRIAQMVIAPVVQAQIIKVEELNETNRGEGGFGSTGK